MAPFRQLSAVERTALFGAEVLVKGPSGKGSGVKKPIADVLGGKYIGLYFCRHDSPPCKKFTPVLLEAYATLRAEGRPFEVLFIISDAHLHALYEQTMPWAAVVGPASFRTLLCNKFGVTNVPTLLVISPEGEVVAPNAMRAIIADPKAFPWEGSTDPAETFWPLVQTIMAFSVLLFTLFLVVFSYFYFSNERMGNLPSPAHDALGGASMTPASLPLQSPPGAGPPLGGGGAGQDGEL